METQTKVDYLQIANESSNWLKEHAKKHNITGFVIGVSGGIDSAVCSTLCAMTGLPVICLRMSIHQAQDQADRGMQHINWLESKYPNVTHKDIDLSDIYDATVNTLDRVSAYENMSEETRFLSLANTRSRLRMITLYALANANKMMVCGTGNKVEDYGIGFFTKYGDGGVDISPIGDLLKSEVYTVGRELGIIDSILSARPTDGLWDDGRTDEDQIGATYDELEWAMEFCDNHSLKEVEEMSFPEMLSARQAEIVKIYWKRHTANSHKMDMPPVFSTKHLR